MTVRQLITELLHQPMSRQVYVGKGMGILTDVASAVSDTGQPFVILSPDGSPAVPVGEDS